METTITIRLPGVRSGHRYPGGYAPDAREWHNVPLSVYHALLKRGRIVEVRPDKQEAKAEPTPFTLRDWDDYKPLNGHKADK